MEKMNIGFIGFGEVASILSKAVKENGGEVKAYDILYCDAEGKRKLESRTGAEEVQFASLPEVVRSADIVLSTVTTQAAKSAAEKCAEFLRPGQVYMDLNSTQPSVKIEIGRMIGRTGANFVEGAILGAVGATGADTRILAAGEKGKEAAEMLTRVGLNVSFYGSEIGKASLYKMLRSIFSKGLEALMIEFLVAGKRAGISEDLWKEITGLLAEVPFERTAANWVQTHVTAYERRYYEIMQVVGTMREIGLEPLMTSATEAFFKRSLSLGFKEEFAQKAGSREQVIAFMESRLWSGKGE